MSRFSLVRICVLVCGLAMASWATPFLEQYASASSVRDIVPAGDFLWLATSNGLYQAPIEEGDTLHYSLPSDFGDIDLVDIEKTEDGYLWFGTHNGYIVSMDLSTERFSRYNSLGYVGWNISCIAAYGDYLLVGSQRGLSFFDRERGVVVSNATRFSDRLGMAVSAIETYGDTIAVVLEDGIAWIAPSSLRRVNFNDPNVWMSIDTSGIAGLVVDRNGFHLHTARVQRSAGNLFEIEKVDNATRILRNGEVRVEALSGDVNAVCEHREVLYVGTEGRYLYRFVPDEPPEQITLQGLPKSDTRAFMIDEQRVMWSMTDNCGDGIGRRVDGQWSVAKGESEADPGLGTMGFGKSDEMNRLLLTTNGDVWVGTFGVGVKWYDRSAQRWYHFEDSIGAAAFGMSYTPSPLARFGPSTGEFWTFASALSEDSTGAIWIGNERAYTGEVVHVFNPLTNRWRSFSTAESSLPTGFICALAAARPGNTNYMYAGFAQTESGSGQGLVQFRYGTDPIDGSVSSSRAAGVPIVVNDIAVASDSIVYVASNSMLYRIRNHDLSTLTAIEMVTAPSTIYALSVSPAGHPVLVMDGDLYEYHDSLGCDPRYDYKCDSLVNLTRMGVLPDAVYDIFYDRVDAAYWISTARGLYRFETAEYVVEQVTDYGDIQVYPNPLSLSRRDEVVYFDRLAPSSRVLLYDISGSLVWQSGSDDQIGRTGQAIRWTGCNQQGRRVKPGTYYYSVFSSDQKRLGKLLVVP